MALETKANIRFETFLQAAALRALLKGLTSIVSATADFEKGMSAVSAISGATGEELDRLGARARQLAQDTIFDNVQVAKAMEELARKGFETGEIIVSIASVLDLAAAGAVGLTRAAEVAGGSLGAFSLEANELNRVVDVLAITAASSDATVHSLGKTLEDAGAITKTVGGSFEEMAAIAGILATSLIKGSKAGIGIKQFLNGIVAPSRRGAAALKELGLTYQDLDTTQRGIIPILLTVGEKFDLVANGMKKANLAAEIWNRRSSNSALIALRNRDGIVKLLDAYKKGTGAAKRMAEVMTDNLAGSFTRFNSLAQEVKTTVGDELSPSLRDLVDDMIAGNKAILETGSSFETVGKFLATVVTSFNIFGKSLAALKELVILNFASIVNAVGGGAAKLIRISAKVAEAFEFSEAAKNLESEARVLEAKTAEFFEKFSGNFDKFGELGLSIEDDFNLIVEVLSKSKEKIKPAIDLTEVSSLIDSSLASVKAAVSSGNRNVETEVKALTDTLNLKKALEGLDISELTEQQIENLKTSLDSLIGLFERTGGDIGPAIAAFRESLNSVSKATEDAAEKTKKSAEEMNTALNEVSSVITIGGQKIEVAAGDIRKAFDELVLGFNSEKIKEDAAELEAVLLRISKAKITIDPAQQAELDAQITEIISAFQKMGLNVPENIKKAGRALGLFVREFQEAGESSKVAGSKISVSIDEAGKTIIKTIEPVKNLNAALSESAVAGERSAEQIRKAQESWQEAGATATESSETLSQSQDRVRDSASQSEEELGKAAEATSAIAKNSEKAATSGQKMVDSQDALKTSLNETAITLTSTKEAIILIAAEMDKIGNKTVKLVFDLSGLEQVKAGLKEILSLQAQVAAGS